MSSRPGSSSPSTPADPFALPARWLYPLLFLVALAAYWPALGGGVLWDDLGHLTRQDLRSFDGLGRIWFEIGATQQYYPLLHSAFWLEHRLWGDATLGYHLTNVFQHALVACLFAALLRRLAVPGAALAALLFALHPVGVESVAWISEQKNTLSAIFYLAAALAYLQWHGRPARESMLGVARGPDPARSPTETPAPPRSAPPLAWERGRPRPLFGYFFATFLFLCALLTKTVTATLPAALLVIFWWRRGKLGWRHDVVPLLPWFGLSIAGGALTAHFERTLIGAQGAAFDLGWIERGLLAGRVVWFYLGKLLWPAELSFIYPRWHVDATAWWQWLFPLATLAVLAVLWRIAHSGSQPSTLNSQLSAPALRRLGEGGRRAPLAAALLFGGTLFPVLGFFNVYPFVFSYVADHFQYLAALAVFALVAAAIAHAAVRWTRPAALSSAGVILLVLGALTWSQAAIYRDGFRLYRDTLAKNPDCWMAHNNLAMLLTESGRPAEAIPHLEQALRIRPDYPQAMSNLGDDLIRLGRSREAIPHLERALALQPDYVQAHNNLGTALLTLDRAAEAIAHFERAVQLDPRYTMAHYNLGLALAQTDRVREAIPHFERVVTLQPTHAHAELSLAYALASTDRFSESIRHFERALELEPDSVEAHQTYARMLARHGQLDQALPHFRAVVELMPQSGAAHRDLGFALRQLGRSDEAMPHFLEAQRLGER
ncbi:tetratricopeptide repeat protein [Opitutus terrae]|uniref:Tetratricopeptide TPR_2 repeat protein n=1 Tax=Opitutus terrae (strain DSM 11246 / JCM 15787 / PB90-1) TaxID=452637 RepID=B1ZP66_OPITP|nr:tetratricopeptide repeat protein [Opitutus terrae]ACB77555.1 Tetratricopeptide TPR_2 repeat protein [Opitutus terrae PB90-1]